MADLELATCRRCDAAGSGLIAALAVLVLVSVIVGGGVWASRVILV